jgi:hypothetical protein
MSVGRSVTFNSSALNVEVGGASGVKSYRLVLVAIVNLDRK